MTDKTNPRAEFDKALALMRFADRGGLKADVVAPLATVACAEALALLVDAQLAAVKPKRKPEPEPDPEPDPRESLPDDAPVGHGWVMDVGGLLKAEGDVRFTLWLPALLKWGSPGIWLEEDLDNPRPATVGDLRRVYLPLSEWPEITAPEPEAEQSEAKAIAERDNAIAALRSIRRQLAALAAGYVHEDDDARSAYRESMHVVETEARRRGLDLNEEVA